MDSGIQYPIKRIRNPLRGIQNPRLSYIKRVKANGHLNKAPRPKNGIRQDQGSDFLFSLQKLNKYQFHSVQNTNKRLTLVLYIDDEKNLASLGILRRDRIHTNIDLVTEDFKSKN